MQAFQETYARDNDNNTLSFKEIDEEFTAVKRSYAKTDGIEAYHGYLSFKEQDITPELTLKIGTEFAQEVWGKRFQVLVAYLDRLSEEVRLMSREKITTDVELLAYKQKLEDKIQTLTDERSALRKHSRRKISADKLKETKDRISHITINLRKLRHELKLCEHIAERSKVMEQGLETVLNDERNSRAKNKSRGYER